jgi:hypothetical protein
MDTGSMTVVTVMTMKYGPVLKGTFVLTPRGMIVATVRWSWVPLGPRK